MRWLVLAGVLLGFAGCAQATFAPQTITAKDGTFKITFPGKARELNQTQTLPNGTTFTVKGYISESAQGGYIIMYSDGLKDQFNRTPEKMLNDARDGLVAATHAKLTSEENVKIEGYPGKIVKFTGQQQGKTIVAEWRYFAAGERLYQIAALGAGKAPPADVSSKYFQSFKLLKK